MCLILGYFALQGKLLLRLNQVFLRYAICNLMTTLILLSTTVFNEWRQI